MWVRSAREVQKIQSNANFITGTSNEQDIIEKLTTFQNTLLSQEESFYNSLGINEQQFKINYASAYARAQGDQSNLLAAENALVEKYRSGGDATEKQKVVDKFIDHINYLIETDDDFHKKLTDFSVTGVDLALDALAEKSGAKFSRQTSRSQGGGLHAKKVGIGTLNLKISQDRKKIVQKVHADTDLISDSFIKKLDTYLNGPQATTPFDKSVFLQDVQEELSKHNLANLIPLLSRVGSSIDANQSEASIRGFFGELYAMAMLENLFGEQGAMIIPTGSIRKSTSGQQIPIDIVLQKGLEQFHFQVKNYNTKNGTISLRGHMNAMNFLENKMLITGHPLEVLTEFLASYQYNQPFEDEGLRELYAEAEMSVDRYESEVYSQFQTIFSQMRYMFDEYAPNLFKIEDLFKAKSGGLFTEQKQYINNFFIVKDRIVPASEIIQQLIDAFRQKPITSYRLTKPTNKEDTLEGNFNTYEHRPDENLLARLVNVSYSITITI